MVVTVTGPHGGFATDLVIHSARVAQRLAVARVGIVTARGLAEKRRYAIVIAFIVAAVLTPPDVISQVMLAVPILILYEISVICARFVEKGRAARLAALDADPVDPPAD